MASTFLSPLHLLQVLQYLWILGHSILKEYQNPTFVQCHSHENVITWHLHLHQNTLYQISNKENNRKKEKSTFTTVTKFRYSNRSNFSLLCFYLDHFCKIFLFHFTNKLSGYLHFLMAKVQSLCETLSQYKVLSEEDTHVPHIWIIIHPLCLCASIFRLRSYFFLLKNISLWLRSEGQV